MKRKIVSMIIIASMVFMLLPQTAAFAAVTAEALDTAIKAMGGLSDKGNIYVSENTLPQSVEIEGGEYPLTYIADPSDVIDSSGNVQHGMKPIYVKVTPQILMGGETVSGSEQTLLILPNESLIKGEFFEDFEGDAYAPDEGESVKTLESNTTYGKFTTGTISSNAQITVKSDNTRYLEVRTNSGSTASGIVAPKVTAPLSTDAFTTGTTVLSMRAMLYVGGSASDIGVSPITVFYSSSASSKQYYLFAHKNYATTTNTITIPNNSWHNYLFIRKNGETPEETTTEVFYDGESIGSYTGERGSLTEFAIEVARAKANFMYADDIMLFGLEETIIPDIKLTDKGNMYVSGNQLPESVNIAGIDYPVTYISDNDAVISASGTVTHTNSYSYVTVTPAVSIAGEQVLGKEQKLLVLPSTYDTLLDEDFETFDEGTIARGETTNGWNSNAYSGTEHIVQEVRNDEKHGNYLYFGAVNPENMGAANPVLKKAFSASTGYEGTTLVGLRMFASPYTSSNGINTTIAQFNKGNITGGNGTSISNSLYVGKWHNFLFEINNEDTVSADGKLYKKAKLYIDGEYMDTFYSQNWKDEMELTFYRGYNQHAMIDDIFVINLSGLIQKLPEVDNIPLANIGNSYVNENLPRSVTIDGSDYEITYETTNPDVINMQGEIVQKDYEYGYSTVTPVVTINGAGGESIKVKGIRTGLTVLPKYANTTIIDDFEGAAVGTNLAMLQTISNRYNTWYGNAQAGVEKVRAVIEEENVTNYKKNKYFAFDVNKPGESTNPVIKLEKEHKDIAGTITATSLRIKYRSDLRVYVGGLGYIRNSRIESSGLATMLTYSNITMKPNEWYNVTLIKNAITLKVKIYINGEYQGEYQYPNATEGDFELFVYRNISQDSCIDDLLVQRITDMGHLEATRDAIDIGDISNVTENVTLPLSADGNVSISWEAHCDESVARIVDSTLFVTRSEASDQSFVLTATLSCNGTAIEREFNVTVKMIRPIELAALSFEQISDGQRENAVTNNLSLPNNCDGGTVSITWSSLSGNVSDSGVITRNILDELASIKAVYTGYGDTFEKIYTFVIRGTGKILYEGSFDDAAEGASVDTLSGWKIGGTEDKHQEKSVDSVIVKDPRDALLSFEDARKVLKVHRFATKNDRAVSNDKAMLTFDEKIKPERTAYDFDFCINDGKVLVELFDMQMTFAITRTGISQYGFDSRMISFNEPLDVGKWYHATIVQDAYLGRYDFYLDYEYIGSETSKGAKGIKGINFYSNAVSSTSYDTFFIANVIVKDVTPSPEAAVAAGINDLAIGEIDYDKAKITLPDHSSENTYVEWKSSHPEIISDKGIVNRTAQTQTVTLTATVSKGEYKEEKPFNVEVLALTEAVVPTAEIMNVIADDLTFDLISDESHLRITKDLNLITSIDFGKAREIGGVTISWESDTPYTITNDGKYRETKYEKAIKLTATISSVANMAVKITKEFLVVPKVKAVIHQYWDFEDTTAETVGETVQDWTNLGRRAFTSETEYGLRQYVDKEPGQEHLPLDKANKVLYLDRAVDKTLASVPSLDYLEYGVPAEDRITIENAGNAIVSFKLMRSNESTSMPMTIYCMTEQTAGIYKTHFFRRRPEPSHTATFKTPMEANKWYEITMFFDLVSHRMDVYVDGVRANDDPFDVPWGHSQFNSLRIFNDSMDPMYLDDFSIRYLTPETGENAVLSDASKLVINQNATEDIALPATGEAGSSIYWESSNSDVITSGGKIFPSSVSDLTATLTASICYNNVLEKREFSINVPRNASVPYEVTNIEVSSNVLKSVSVRENMASANAQLMVMIYDKERLVGIKTFDGVQSGEFLLNYDLTSLKNYKVTAFVWNKTKVLSNKKSINWGGSSK